MLKWQIASILVGCATNAFACKPTGPADIAAALQEGIELKERFKRSVGFSDRAKYEALRQQTETYDETTTLPCVEKAARLLEQTPNSDLLLQLMRLAVSYENSADETIASAMGQVLLRRPIEVAETIELFSPSEARIVLRSLEWGWLNTRESVPQSDRRNVDSALESIRASLRRSGAVK